jgi:3-oxoacyl-[acyl-carrier protein] reductase
VTQDSNAPRTAIVTGAAQGIGWAIAARFLRDGWSVVAVDITETRLPPALAGSSARFHALVQDITAPQAAQAVVATTLAKFGALDILINNAGIGNAAAVHETTDEDLDRFLEVNFVSAFRMSREALQVMRPGSAIVHVASALALRGTPGTSSYVASKGVIETALTAERLKSNAAFRRTWADGTPWPRLGRAGDVAAAVRFLASEDAEFVNGHVLVVDGGWSAGAPG